MTNDKDRRESASSSIERVAWLDENKNKIDDFSLGVDLAISEALPQEDCRHAWQRPDSGQLATWRQCQFHALFWVSASTQGISRWCKMLFWGELHYIPVVPARGGAEVALKIYMRPFSSIELACAVRQPSPCVRAHCESCVLLHMSHLKPHVTLHTWQSSHFTLHPSQSTLHTSQFTLRSPQSTLHTPHFTLHSPHFTLLTSHFTLHTPHFTLHSSRPTLHTALFTLHTSSHLSSSHLIPAHLFSSHLFSYVI